VGRRVSEERASERKAERLTSPKQLVHALLLPRRLVADRIDLLVLLQRRDEDIGVQPRLGESEEGHERAEGHSLLHRVAVEVTRFGMLAQIGDLLMIPDE
jgi:hypothetical protein